MSELTNDCARVCACWLVFCLTPLAGHAANPGAGDGTATLPLERILDEHPRDPRAPLAAIVLARVEMDVLERPLRAREALRRAEALGVPRALQPEIARRIDALDADAADADADGRLSPPAAPEPGP